MSALGLTGWAAEELMLGHGTWLAWPAVFALFGSVAPLFALLAQPHRGAREPLAATTAVDIAGLAVVTGFLYSFFITAPTSMSLAASSRSCSRDWSWPGWAAAMFAARRTDVARRLSPADARRACQLRYADDQQRRRRAGRLPLRLRLRLHLDPAVRLLPVGGDDGAGIEGRRRPPTTMTKSWRGRGRG